MPLFFFYSLKRKNTPGVSAVIGDKFGLCLSPKSKNRWQTAACCQEATATKRAPRGGGAAAAPSHRIVTLAGARHLRPKLGIGLQMGIVLASWRRGPAGACDALTYVIPETRVLATVSAARAAAPRHRAA